MVKRFDQRIASLGIVEQIILQIGVAAYDPDVAQYFVEHARRAAGLTRAAQFGEQCPCVLTEQPNDDFAIGE